MLKQRTSSLMADVTAFVVAFSIARVKTFSMQVISEQFGDVDFKSTCEYLARPPSHIDGVLIGFLEQCRGLIATTAVLALRSSLKASMVDLLGSLATCVHVAEECMKQYERHEGDQPTMTTVHSDDVIQAFTKVLPLLRTTNYTPGSQLLTFPMTGQPCTSHR